MLVFPWHTGWLLHVLVGCVGIFNPNGFIPPPDEKSEGEHSYLSYLYQSFWLCLTEVSHILAPVQILIGFPRRLNNSSLLSLSLWFSPMNFEILTPILCQE